MNMREEAQRKDRLAALLAAIESGTQTREEVFSVIYALLGNGESVPPRLELCSLNYILQENPRQVSVKQRMVSVYNLLGETPPEELRELAEGYIQEEHAANHQEALREYAAKVGYKDFDPAFFPLFEAVRAYTMTSAERLYSLWSCVRYLHARGRKGDFMEVGVWRGGSMMLAAMTLRQLKADDRPLWLYDTFTGLPRPDEALDTDILDNRAIDGWLPRSFDGRTSAWAYADEEEVRANMRETGYPEELVHFIAGKVEDTIPAVLPEKIALLRIDTDFYSSYKHTLEYAYDRLVPGGICILDDYGHFRGARKAVDEFLDQRGLCVLMHRPDYSCRIFVKE